VPLAYIDLFQKEVPMSKPIRFYAMLIAVGTVVWSSQFRRRA
jgi:hypothetical protein